MSIHIIFYLYIYIISIVFYIYVLDKDILLILQIHNMYVTNKKYTYYIYIL